MSFFKKLCLSAKNFRRLRSQQESANRSNAKHGGTLHAMPQNMPSDVAAPPEGDCDCLGHRVVPFNRNVRKKSIDR